jgi:hypothetical protein
MQFCFWEYINRNQTFILDSHRPFISSVFPNQIVLNPYQQTPLDLSPKLSLHFMHVFLKLNYPSLLCKNIPPPPPTSTIVMRYEFICPGEIYVHFPGKEINVQHSSDDTQEYACICW